jgi:hypothetical protein
MVALLLAPVLTGVAVGLVLGLLQGVQGVDVVETTVAFLMLSAMLGWPLAFVFGLPLHLLLWRRRSVTILHYAVGGALIALIGWAFVAGPDAGGCWLNGGVDGYCWEIWRIIYPDLLPLVVVPSAIAGVVFWLIMTNGQLWHRTKTG